MKRPLNIRRYPRAKEIRLTRDYAEPGYPPIRKPPPKGKP